MAGTSPAMTMNRFYPSPGNPSPLPVREPAQLREPRGHRAVWLAPELEHREVVLAGHFLVPHPHARRLPAVDDDPGLSQKLIRLRATDDRVENASGLYRPKHR